MTKMLWSVLTRRLSAAASDNKPCHQNGERKVVLRGTSPAPDGKLLARSQSGKPMNNLELVERLCAVSERLADLRRLHVRNLGSLMPHVFMGDVLTHVRHCLTAETARERLDRRPEVEAILGVLDTAAGTAGADTRHVIVSSFLRDGERASFFPELRAHLGRKLQTLVARK
jgi:hypothetical protein